MSVILPEKCTHQLEITASNTLTCFSARLALLTFDALLTEQARSCCRAEVFAIFQATVQTTTA
jgi:hypothetical protein